MYVITGVSGHTGSVVASSLLKQGKPVRVIVRAEEKRKSWKAQGAEVALASLDDAGKLRPVVETVLPLSEARRAQELSQTGHTRSKIVLRVV